MFDNCHVATIHITYCSTNSALRIVQQIKAIIFRMLTYIRPQLSLLVKCRLSKLKLKYFKRLKITLADPSGQKDRLSVIFCDRPRLKRKKIFHKVRSLFFVNFGVAQCMCRQVKYVQVLLSACIFFRYFHFWQKCCHFC